MGPGKKILHPLHVEKFATILVGVVTELTETYLFKHNEDFFHSLLNVLVIGLSKHSLIESNAMEICLVPKSKRKWNGTDMELRKEKILL